MTVTVTVQGNDIFINNAKILASNLILENGVAHVLDQVRLQLLRLCSILFCLSWFREFRGGMLI